MKKKPKKSFTEEAIEFERKFIGNLLDESDSYLEHLKIQVRGVLTIAFRRGLDAGKKVNNEEHYLAYIKLLSDELTKNSGYLFVHGIEPDPKLVEEGKRLRKLLAIAE